MIATFIWVLLLGCAALGLWWYGKGVTEHFLGPQSLETLWHRIIPIALLVGPMAVIMLGGGLDLSVGAVVALASVVSATALSEGQSPEEAFFLAMIFAGGVGLLHGLLVSVAAINPIVLTLVTTVLIQGLATSIAGDQPHILIGRDPGFLESLYHSPLLPGVSVGISLLLIQLAQIGGGSGGLPVTRQPWYRRTFFIALPYILSSLGAGVIGCSLVGQMRAGSPLAAPQMAFMVVFAALIGGNCSGRRFGSVIGAVAAAVVFVVLENTMLMDAVATDLITFIMAAAAGGSLLLSQLLYWIINLIYRKSRVKTQPTV
ncbi:MAG: hypothetical protein QGG42_18730 [Phycisphaerae bacterium]|jgi:ribose transport system permease protein|nr:hypothetical protein [Phycisphaerae bacterium]